MNDCDYVKECVSFQSIVAFKVETDTSHMTFKNIE